MVPKWLQYASLIGVVFTITILILIYTTIPSSITLQQRQVDVLGTFEEVWSFENDSIKAHLYKIKGSDGTVCYIYSADGLSGGLYCLP